MQEDAAAEPCRPDEGLSAARSCAAQAAAADPQQRAERVGAGQPESAKLQMLQLAEQGAQAASPQRRLEQAAEQPDAALLPPAVPAE